MKLLDFDTGGGEFLLSLGHPYGNTAATEGYPPNVELCKKELQRLGIDFKACDDALKYYEEALKKEKMASIEAYNAVKNKADLNWLEQERTRKSDVAFDQKSG